MTALDLSSALTALFIFGMIWLRTRMQYVGAGRTARNGSGNADGSLLPRAGRRLQLERAGRVYFTAALALLALGWLLAPMVGVTFWPASGSNPSLTRVIWFLLCYYVFIVIHRTLKVRGIAVFRARDR